MLTHKVHVYKGTKVFCEGLCLRRFIMSYYSKLLWNEGPKGKVGSASKIQWWLLCSVYEYKGQTKQTFCAVLLQHQKSYP